MFRVRHVMKRDPITVHQQANILSALDKLVEFDITALMVVDEQGNLVGLISEFDLLKLLYEPSEECHPVSHYMTRVPLTVDVDDRLVDVVDTFLKKNIRRVPVLEEGRLVGVLSRSDVIRFIRNTRVKVARRQQQQQLQQLQVPPPPVAQVDADTTGPNPSFT